MEIKYPVRINKYLALKNFSTRRGADELIEQGKVMLNGKKAKLGDMVNEKDEVSVKGAKTAKDYVYFAYNKPVGVVTTMPTKNEKEILDVIKFPQKVFPVGRLDKDSHGLIIFTNDGRITDKLLNPNYSHEKEYIVKLDKPMKETFIKKMTSGVRIGDYLTKKCKAKKITKNTFSIILEEGKKRQIRRMAERFEYHVTDLKRVRVMNVLLGNLPQNSFREVKDSELDTFLKSLGL